MKLGSNETVGGGNVKYYAVEHLHKTRKFMCKTENVTEFLEELKVKFEITSNFDVELFDDEIEQYISFDTSGTLPPSRTKLKIVVNSFADGSYSCNFEN
jgi:hypothetical protein